MEPLGLQRKMAQYKTERKSPQLLSHYRVIIDGSIGNEPFGSRSEPGIQKTRRINQSTHGEIPKGRADVPRQATRAWPLS
jgi:hypothetical protein